MIVIRLEEMCAFWERKTEPDRTVIRVLDIHGKLPGADFYLQHKDKTIRFDFVKDFASGPSSARLYIGRGDGEIPYLVVYNDEVMFITQVDATAKLHTEFPPAVGATNLFSTRTIYSDATRELLARSVK